MSRDNQLTNPEKLLTKQEVIAVYESGKSNISQLAKAAGVSRRTVQRWLKYEFPRAREVREQKLGLRVGKVYSSRDKASDDLSHALVLYAGNAEGRFSGKNGGSEHRAIVDLLRFSVASVLRRAYPNAWCTTHYTLMAAMCGTVKTKVYPDLVFGPDRQLSERVVIEVGRFNPEKWPSSWPVLHIAFSGRVTRINSEDSGFQNHLYDLICKAVPVVACVRFDQAMRCPTCLKALKDIIFCEFLWYSGLTCAEALGLRWRHLIPTKDGGAIMKVMSEEGCVAVEIPPRVASRVWQLKAPDSLESDCVFQTNLRSFHETLKTALKAIDVYS
ncbi:MAG: helix-turn-helix domain-containing protein [Leptolyngbya sp. SIO1D8]|nr:helix-turn-helix domain-containing protein [Leptolyngbya sp. SIO1D8]